ncbi:MAG: hypothetical protein CMH63_03195 [Nanoarchaeota archaeon]|jgi:hypothetical protein|nr:hypothetical protein [Nanoarchaeota archaeon]|tara:strand:- start:12335 stop:13309 length:975 start_codon:yes stop_codon:yes gene_type:complete
MQIEYKRGYTVYTKGNKELCFVAIHSGPAIENPVHRDDHSETVASLSWKELGGTLVVSGVSRDRLWGIDYNRYIPSIGSALRHYEKFIKNPEGESLLDFTRKYAWVAKDEGDYYERLKVYQSFWNDVSKGKYIVLVHKNFPKMKAVPSVMDFITFSNIGIKKRVIKDIVSDVNSKYFDFFEKIKSDYRAAILADTRRFVLNVMRIYGHFNPAVMSEGYRMALEKDLEKVSMYCDKIALNRLRNNFNPYNFLMCVQNALTHIPLPQVTIEGVHDGSLALGPYNKLFPKRDKTVIEVESNGFLNFWHPHMAAKIMNDVIKKVMEEG